MERPAGAPSAVQEPLREALGRLRSGVDADAAFGALDGALRPRLLNYFRANSFSREDSEDLVQKTLLRVFKGIGGLQEEEKFLAWLFTIARNVLRTAVGERRRSPAASVPLDSLPAEPNGTPGSSEDEAADQERVEAVWRAIEALPLRQRQCLPLQVRDGLSYEEIAATLRLSVHTVRNHLAAARRSLRRILAAELEEGC